MGDHMGGGLDLGQARAFCAVAETGGITRAARRLGRRLLDRAPIGAPAGVRVWREPLVWVASPDWRTDPAMPTPLVAAPRPCVYRERAFRALEADGRPWRMAYASPSLAGALAAPWRRCAQGWAWRFRPRR